MKSSLCNTWAFQNCKQVFVITQLHIFVNSSNIIRKRINRGTVSPSKMSPGVALPLFKIHLGGTVPPFKMHSEGIVPSFKMHRRVCKNFYAFFFTWIWLVQQTSTRVNLYSLKQTNIHISLTLVKESHVYHHNKIFIDLKNPWAKK